jgi:GTPase SAR1 family protein/molecular chaperone GrpE (heat shock protein)
MSEQYRQYSEKRELLCRKLEELAALPSASAISAGSAPVRDVLAELVRVIRQDRFRVAVIGEFSSGKSSLLNVLLGKVSADGRRADGLLPAAIDPTTAVITSIYHSEKQEVWVELENGTTKQVSPDDLQALLCPPELRQKKKWFFQRNPVEMEAMSARVREVRVGLDAEIVRFGVDILDTPGLGSVHADHSAITRRCVAGVDAALFLVAVDPPMGEQEMTFLQYVSGFTDRLMFVMTKADLSERLGHEKGRPVIEARLEDTRRRIAQVIGRNDFSILLVSSALAADAVRSGDAERLERSGIPVLRQALEQLLVQVRGAERFSGWVARARVAQSIMTAALTAERNQLEAKAREAEIPRGTEEEYHQWQAAVPIFTDHMRSLRTRTTGQIQGSLDHICKAVLRDVMPLLNSLDGAMLKQEKHRLRLERGVVEAVQRHTKLSVASVVDDAVVAAHQSVQQTLGTALPQAIASVSSGLDVGNLLQTVEAPLSVSSMVTTKTVQRERNPSGFWESIGSLFGKTYYQRVEEHEVNRAYFESSVESAVQNVVVGVVEQVETYLQQVARTTEEEMRRLEAAARDRDKRAAKIQAQSHQEAQARLAAVDDELLVIDKLVESLPQGTERVADLDRDRVIQ